MTPLEALVGRLRATRANMLGTDDEQHYWDCHAAADALEAAGKDAREAENDAAAVRELLNVYNLGGWTDAIAPMKRALAAEELVLEQQTTVRELQVLLDAANERAISLLEQAEQACLAVRDEQVVSKYATSAECSRVRNIAWECSCRVRALAAPQEERGQ